MGPVMLIFQKKLGAIYWQRESRGTHNLLSLFGLLIANRNLSLLVLEAGNPRSRQQHDHILMRVLFLVHTGTFHCALTWWKGMGSPWNLFYVALNPFTSTPQSWPNNRPKALKTIIFGNYNSTWICVWGHIQTITPLDLLVLKYWQLVYWPYKPCRGAGLLGEDHVSIVVIV